MLRNDYILLHIFCVYNRFDILMLTMLCVCVYSECSRDNPALKIRRVKPRNVFEDNLSDYSCTPRIIIYFFFYRKIYIYITLVITTFYYSNSVLIKCQFIHLIPLNIGINFYRVKKCTTRFEERKSIKAYIVRVILS